MEWTTHTWNGLLTGGANNATANLPLFYPLEYRIFAGILVSIIFLVGSVGNVLVIAVVLSTRSMHTPTNCYLVSLACADIILLVSAAFPTLVELFYAVDQTLLGTAGCALMVFSQYLGVNVSALSITAFTVERYIAIGHPMRARTICTVSRAIKIILVLWVGCTLYCSPWLGLITARATSYSDGSTVERCTYRLARGHYTTFYLTDFIIFYVVPLLLTSILYGLIGRALYKSQSDSSLRRTNGGMGGAYRVEGVVSARVGVAVGWGGATVVGGEAAVLGGGASKELGGAAREFGGIITPGNNLNLGGRTKSQAEWAISPVGGVAEEMEVVVAPATIQVGGSVSTVREAIVPIGEINATAIANALSIGTAIEVAEAVPELPKAIAEIATAKVAKNATIVATAAASTIVAVQTAAAATAGTDKIVTTESQAAKTEVKTDESAEALKIVETVDEATAVSAADITAAIAVVDITARAIVVPSRVKVASEFGEDTPLVAIAAPNEKGRRRRPVVRCYSDTVTSQTWAGMHENWFHTSSNHQIPLDDDICCHGNKVNYSELNLTSFRRIKHFQTPKNCKKPTNRPTRPTFSAPPTRLSRGGTCNCQNIDVPPSWHDYGGARNNKLGVKNPKIQEHELKRMHLMSDKYCGKSILTKPEFYPRSHLTLDDRTQESRSPLLSDNGLTSIAESRSLTNRSVGPQQDESRLVAKTSNFSREGQIISRGGASVGGASPGGGRIRTPTYYQQHSKESTKSFQSSRVQVVKMLAVVVIAFAVLWLPYRAYVVYNSFAKKFDSVWLLLFCRLMVYVNSAINPILYNAISAKFRRSFIDFLACRQRSGGQAPSWRQTMMEGRQVASSRAVLRGQSGRSRGQGQGQRVSQSRVGFETVGFSVDYV